ncbi:MAG: hypothetical protein AB7Q81_19630 [Gammaproteobacteria bacterium]
MSQPQQPLGPDAANARLALATVAARARRGRRALRGWLLMGLSWLLMAAGGVCAAAAAALEGEVPRTVIALYDARRGPIHATSLHRFLEMPANHLGLVFEFHDLSQPLPDLVARDDVRGVVMWQRSPDVADPDAFLAWLEEAQAGGKRIVILGDLVAATDRYGQYLDHARLDRVLGRIGIALDASAAEVGVDARIARADSAMIGFEHRLDAPLPDFAMVHKVDGATSYLAVRPTPAAPAAVDLVVVGAAGGYIARDYALYRGLENNQRQWIVDPFAFLRAAFATDDLPKPDTTTLAGRRIYYSHIDGDGWRNVSLADEYEGHDVISARVVLEEAIRPFADLPVTVAPITADLDPDWYGDDEARAAARDLFALPQVEVGTHTHTHPFAWGFFEHYDAAREAAFLSRYETMHGGRYFGWEGLNEQSAHQLAEDEENLSYTAAYVPRAYALKPFDVALEVAGSVAIVERLSPRGKRARVIQWSGDTLPFESVMAASAAAGLGNINGGDSRFDGDFPSYAFVAPVGRRVGPYWQVYSSNSNENTYTDLWRRRFYAFGFLPQTLERTESPRRVRAANVYYHMYSGERQASLRALLQNLQWARRHALIPIETSRFATIGSGFFTTRLVAAGPRTWTVLARGGLQTLRFDDADERDVDWAGSQGVIGRRRHQGSLYVALDEMVETPRVALTDTAQAAAPLYLVESRWRVYDCRLDGEHVQATASGYGVGEMLWQGRAAQRYVVTVADARRFEILADGDGLLRFDLGQSTFVPVRFAIARAAATLAATP